ncbi:MAG TPA: HAMP domain-containing protein [Roseiflexaceae bacterium]|jgi:two-component system sensor histidine kinase CpxA
MIVVVVLAIAAGLSLFFPTRLMRPVRTLQMAAARLAKGDLAARVALDRGDELGTLGQSFNTMADSLTSSPCATMCGRRRAILGWG